MTVPALLLAGVLQADAVWLCFLIGESLTLLTIIVCAAVRKRGVAIKLSDYLFLKEPFGVKPENILDFSISKSEDVIPASSAVERFCGEKGARAKESMMLSLFVEELGNNIVQYGFSDGKKHSIDVRAIKLDDGWKLRIRDDCKRFDPTEWIKLHNTDNPAKNIGIRMVCGMAKDINYLSTMELNNICNTI